jgi:DNA repair protein RadD
LPLRPYQEAALVAVSSEWRQSRRAVLLVSPTGSGKTAMGCEAVRRALHRGKRALWLTHRRELLSQASERLDSEGIPHGIILAGHPAHPTAPVQVASVDTLRNREKPPADLLVWDEAHHAVSASQLAIRDVYRHAHHLGLSATPQRSDGRAMGDAFDALVVAASVRQLQADGFLVPVDFLAPDKETDTRTIAHDPVSAYLGTEITVDGLTYRTRDRRAVVYAATVKQAEEFTRAFNAAGVAAACVEGKTAKDERAWVLREVSTGGLRVVVNCQVLTEGWDAPALEVCILARRVGASGLYLQMVGRVLRTTPGKRRALVLDLGGSVHRHGRPEADREYTLDGKGIYLAGKREPLGVCAGCGLEVQVWPCTRCGYEPPSRDVEIEERPLALITENPTPQLEEKHLARLIRRAAERGYKPGWVAHQYKSLFGAELPRDTWRRVKGELETSEKWRAARAQRERGAGGDPAGPGAVS